MGQYSQISLYPGELYIAETPTVVWTLLGSCLAVIFHNTRQNIGAICHAQLAEITHNHHVCSDHCPSPCFAKVSETSPFKYVSCSIRYMLDNFAQRGIVPEEIDVKLFGGAAILPTRGEIKPVGVRNIEVAQKMVEAFDLHIVSKHVGGINGRTLYFYSDTGEVFLKHHRR